MWRIIAKTKTKTKNKTPGEVYGSFKAQIASQDNTVFSSLVGFSKDSNLSHAIYGMPPGSVV